MSLTLEEYKLKAKRIVAYWAEHVNFNSAEQILLEQLSDRIQASKTKHIFKIHFTALKQFHNQYVKPVLQYEKDLNHSLLSIPTVPATKTSVARDALKSAIISRHEDVSDTTLNGGLSNRKKEKSNNDAPSVPREAKRYRLESDFDVAMQLATSFFKKVHVNTNPSANDVVKAQQDELDYYIAKRK
jgi:hypothetical protein